MSHTTELPTLVAFVTSFFVVLGAGIALIGSAGLLRFKTFYERVHAPTLGTTLGTGLVLIASTVMFSALELRATLHGILVAIFTIVTTPVTFVLLMRAALHRDSAEGHDPTVEKN